MLRGVARNKRERHVIGIIRTRIYLGTSTGIHCPISDIPPSSSNGLCSSQVALGTVRVCKRAEGHDLSCASEESIEAVGMGVVQRFRVYSPR